MKLRAVAAGATDVGRRRERNEDRFAIVEHQRLFIVADGMGGHRCGDTASRLATETIVEFFRRSGAADFEWPHHVDPRLSAQENRLLGAIRAANRCVHERGLESSACRGMGSTVVTALFDADAERMIVGHVGDSRAYRVRDGQIARLTRDHSLASEGNPAIEAPWFERLTSSVLTRAIGTDLNTIVDLRVESVCVGDTFLLCSDGLTSQASDLEILGVLLQAPDLPRACSRLIAQANLAGGDDNITVVALRIERLRVGPG